MFIKWFFFSADFFNHETVSQTLNEYGLFTNI